MAVRGLGLLALLLGFAVWIFDRTDLRDFHQLAGVLLVLCLWALAVIAMVSGLRPALPVVAIAYGVLVAVLGSLQTSILPEDPAHTVVRVVHLLIGLGAIGLAEVIAGQLRRRRPVVT